MPYDSCMENFLSLKCNSTPTQDPIYPEFDPKLQVPPPRYFQLWCIYDYFIFLFVIEWKVKNDSFKKLGIHKK